MTTIQKQGYPVSGCEGEGLHTSWQYHGEEGELDQGRILQGSDQLPIQ